MTTIFSRSHDTTGRKRVWRDGWASDMFEVFEPQQYAAMKASLARLSIHIEELEDYEDECPLCPDCGSDKTERDGETIRCRECEAAFSEDDIAECPICGQTGPDNGEPFCDCKQ